MPDSRRSSANYGERNSRVLPLEPGHRFSLGDSMALASAASSTLVAELEISLPQVPRPRNSPPNSVQRNRVFPLLLQQFRIHYPDEQFDVVTGLRCWSTKRGVRGAERPQSRAVAHLAGRSGRPTLEPGVTASHAEGAWEWRASFGVQCVDSGTSRRRYCVSGWRRLVGAGKTAKRSGDVRCGQRGRCWKSWKRKRRNCG